MKSVTREGDEAPPLAKSKLKKDKISDKFDAFFSDLKLRTIIWPIYGLKN